MEQLGALPGPPAPMFGYHDITIGALAWLAPHIQVNQNVSFEIKDSLNTYLYVHKQMNVVTMEFYFLFLCFRFHCSSSIRI